MSLSIPDARGEVLTGTRDKLTAAAFELFEAQGYESTTIDDIAARAGVGRTTFFRTFRTKDEVVFPDHERILTATRDHLARTGTADPVRAARDAVVFVLRQHLQKPDVARSRYRLTSVVPALRDREISSTSDYQRLFYEHFRHAHPGDALQAELLAATCVTVHNHVLRRWLRDPFADPEAHLASHLDGVLARLSADHSAGRPQPTEIAVLRTTRALEDVLPALRAALDPTTPPGPRPSDGADSPGGKGQTFGRDRRSGQGGDGVGGGQDPASVVDVEVLHHPAVDGHDRVALP